MAVVIYDIVINLARFIHSTVVCKVCSVSSKGSLFPGAHVRVNGYTVVRSVTQLLLTNFSAAGPNK